MQREAKRGQGDRSLPTLVTGEGGRSVGNREERHSWRDYVSFLGSRH